MPEDIMTSRFGGAALEALSERVGELVTSVWDFSLGLLVNLIFLARNAENLTEAMKQLEELRDDLISLVAEQEARQAQHEMAKRVSGWMERVKKQRLKVNYFQDSLDRQSMCITGICLGYDAAQLLRQVNKLMEEGNALPRNELVCRRSQDSVEVVRSETSSSSMVGADEALRRIQGHILENGVGIIGIYGMGGVGKTSLLKIINNEFLQGEGRGRLFDIAIWVTVSRLVKILGIQKTVGDRLGLSLSDDEQQGDILEQQQADRLFRELSKKRFILLLDDVWQKLDLVKIGIPLPKNANINCKILFTTRFIGVCNAMGTDRRVEVRKLDGKSSWELFRSKLSTEAVVDPDIRQLAGQVVARCGGLPISLITVGIAMANATTPNEWRHAINALDHCATELSGMEDVLATLKFSFDMLKDDTLRSCLLYCGLFPEDYSIPKGQIIDYWVCEGFLDPEYSEDVDIDDTRNRGHGRISDLQNACLLEKGDYKETVRLHDTVLDMVQWVTNQDFVVLSDSKNTARVPQLGRWETAKRISLWGNSVRCLQCGSLNCPNLTTLLLQPRLHGEQVPEGFFNYRLPALRVLVLKYFSFEEIPKQITSVVQLQYLDLSYANITSLPTELGNLVNLRLLFLTCTRSLRLIPGEAISRLTRLQVLDMWGSGYVFSRETRHRKLELSDLENLPQLCELSLEVSSGFPLGDTMTKKIGYLSNLRKLWLHGDIWLGDITTEEISGDDRSSSQLPNLEVFCFVPSRGGPLFPRLRELEISGVHGFTELTWVGQLPRLETLKISDCLRVTELLLLHGAGLPHDGSTPPFPKLKTMSLMELPALSRISTCPLDFPSLKELWVIGCPNLRRLPFGPEGAKNIRLIRGEQEWWDGLEWDNYPDGTCIKPKFLPHFRKWGLPPPSRTPSFII